MNALNTPIHTNKQQPHPITSSAEPTRRPRLRPSRFMPTAAASLLKLALLAALTLTGITSASAVHYRKRIGDRDYLIHDRVNFKQRIIFGQRFDPATFDDLIAGMDRRSLYQGGDGASSGWYHTSGDEMANANYITDLHLGGAGTQGWLHAPGGQLQYVGRGYNVHFFNNSHHFGNTAPYTAPLVTRIQDTNACNANFYDCPEHTRPIAGADYSIDLGDARQRLVLDLPGIWDTDVNLDEAFFEYQNHADTSGWHRIHPHWVHNLKYDHPSLGRVTMDEHGGAWIHFHPWDLNGAGTYKFRGYARDTDGLESTPTESQKIQIWGPPEPRSLRLDTETFYEGRTHTLKVEVFHPNGIETRTNIYLEGEGIEGRTRLNDAEITARGYQVTFSQALYLEKPGNYRVIAEITDEHGRAATEKLTLDITCHPTVIIQGLGKERMVLETGYDFNAALSDEVRQSYESKLQQAIDHYEYLVHHCDEEIHLGLIAQFHDRVETSWEILGILKALGQGGDTFKNREREHYYSLATYYYHLALEAKEAFYALPDYEYKALGIRLAHWHRYSLLSLEAQSKAPEGVNIAYPDATELRDLPIEL